jgi:anti-sigma regulatory factor (Ser/Thr protein kinase)
MVPSVIKRIQDLLIENDFCDERGKWTIGIALEEAILNAIYHGNLELSSELKQEGNDCFYQLAAERAKIPPFSFRRVEIRLRLTPQEVKIIIRDEGPGFDVSAIPDPTDCKRLEIPSGRGIMMIRAYMDEVIYNQQGNEITLIKRRII